MNSAAEPAASIAVLDGPEQVAAVLPPLRRRILEVLGDGDSATGLSRRLDVSRQKLNYHLHELEDAGLVECVGERRRRGCIERRFRATARAWVLSPRFLGGLGADPETLRDRFSSAYLMAVASRTLRDVATLRERALAVEKPLSTISLETDVAFASPAELEAFGEELTAHLATLVSRYSKPDAAGSRRFRFSLAGHPVVTKSENDAAAEASAHAARRDLKPKEPQP